MGYFVIGFGSLLMAVETVVEKIVGNTETLPIVHKAVFFISYMCLIGGLIVDLKDELDDLEELIAELFKHLIFIGMTFLLCYILSITLIWGFFLMFILVAFLLFFLGSL